MNCRLYHMNWNNDFNVCKSPWEMLLRFNYWSFIVNLHPSKTISYLVDLKDNIELHNIKSEFRIYITQLLLHLALLSFLRLTFSDSLFLAKLQTEVWPFTLSKQLCNYLIVITLLSAVHTNLKDTWSLILACGSELCLSFPISAVINSILVPWLSVWWMEKQNIKCSLIYSEMVSSTQLCFHPTGLSSQIIQAFVFLHPILVL